MNATMLALTIIVTDSPAAVAAYQLHDSITAHPLGMAVTMLWPLPHPTIGSSVERITP